MYSRADMRNQAGFSLLELLIVLVVMLVITGSVFSLMRDAIKVSTTTYELTDAQESLRTAQEYLNRDLTVTGDGLKGINNIRLRVGFVLAYITQNPVVDPSDPGYANFSIISSDDNVPATTAVAGTAPAVNVLGGTDRITLLVRDSTFTPVALPAGAITTTGSNVSVTPADVGRFNVGEIYFITCQDRATFGAITSIGGNNNLNLIFTNGDLYGLNQPGNGGPINAVAIAANGTSLPTTLMRMRMIHYFVNANGLLIRRVFGVGGGTGFTDSVIAEHVANLQFRYSLSLRDANNNLRQPVVALTTEQQQITVQQVEVTVTTETVHPVNVRMVNGAMTATPQQVTMTTSTGIRNLQFQRVEREESLDP